MKQIAKRYTNALVEGASLEDVTAYANIFKALAASLNDEKVKNIFFSPYMNKAEKETVLLAAVEKAKSDKVNNLIRLLVENKRTNVMDAIASELHGTVETMSKSYTGSIESNISISAESIKTIEANMAKKVDANVALEVNASKYDGIKVNVDSLGLEVGLSKTVVKDQMIQHILKSI